VRIVLALQTGTRFDALCSTQFSTQCPSDYCKSYQTRVNPSSNLFFGNMVYCKAIPNAFQDFQKGFVAFVRRKVWPGLGVCSIATVAIVTYRSFVASPKDGLCQSCSPYEALQSSHSLWASGVFQHLLPFPCCVPWSQKHRLDLKDLHDTGRQGTCSSFL
jgi:hypothetical protein